eukprot:jgi/Psemu1/32903/gm1.32903_g
MSLAYKEALCVPTLLSQLSYTASTLVATIPLFGKSNTSSPLARPRPSAAAPPLIQTSGPANDTATTHLPLMTHINSLKVLMKESHLSNTDLVDCCLYLFILNLHFAPPSLMQLLHQQPDQQMQWSAACDIPKPFPALLGIPMKPPDLLSSFSTPNP